MTTHAPPFFVRLLYIPVGAVLAAVSCLFVLPLLSAVLWLRGLGTVVQYVQQVKETEGAWGRRQGDKKKTWSLCSDGLVSSLCTSIVKLSSSQFLAPLSALLVDQTFHS